MTKERMQLSVQTVKENIAILESQEPQDAGYYLQLEHEKFVLEALEKQIPKKPINVILTNYKFSFDCPNCKINHTNEWCGTQRKLPFCSICGQALDWSEEE